jgi:hypothetical protein
MSSPPSGLLSTPTLWGKVDFGPTIGSVFRPLNPKRIVTAAGDVTIQPFDVIVIILQTVPAILNVLLPDLALWMNQPYGGFDLIIKNGNVGFDATIVPFGTQKIDGAAFATLSGGQGEGATIFSPLNDKSGWLTL